MKQRRLFFSAGCGVLGLLVLCASTEAAPEAKQKGEASPARASEQVGAKGKDRGKHSEQGRPEGAPGRQYGEHRSPPSGSAGPGPMPSGSAGPEHPGHRGEGDAGERKERRKHHLSELRGRWGDDTLKRPAAREELKHHAWRLARLKRMRDLATEKKNDKQLLKLDELEKKEQARHEKAMARHQLGGAPPVASGAPAPSAAASAPVHGGQP